MKMILTPLIVSRPPMFKALRLDLLVVIKTNKQHVLEVFKEIEKLVKLQQISEKKKGNVTYNTVSINEYCDIYCFRLQS